MKMTFRNTDTRFRAIKANLFSKLVLGENDIVSWNSLKRLTCCLLLFLLSISQAQLSVLIDNGISTAKSGDVVTGKVRITNVSPEKDINARLYLQDLTNSVAGDAYQDLEVNSNERTNLPWIILTTTEALVPARTTVEVPFQIIVPNSAELQGSYWGIIMVQGEPKLVVEADPETEGSLGVQIVSRHALNVIIDIGDGFAELAFSNPQLITEDATQFVVDVTNSGNKIVSPESYLELYSEAGDFMGRVDGSAGHLRPDNQKRINFDLSTVYLLNDDGEQEIMELPEGTYATNLIADAGGVDIFGVRYNLTIGSP